MRILKDRVAVVTGAASGIGREVSVALARAECDLAVADVNAQGLNETAGLIEQLQRKVSIHVIDVSDRRAMEALPEEVMDAHHRVHLVVNNAGVTVADNVREGLVEDFEWIMGINFWGVYYGCKFFLPLLLETDEAHIVNLSSVFGLVGVPHQAYYCTTKFAVRGFTESLRQELAETRVRVTCVHPGGIDTNIARNARFRRPGAMGGETHEDMIQRFTELAKTTPARAAEKIVEGIKKNKARVLIGRDAKMLDLIQRLFPVRYPSVLGAFVSREEARGK
jgi:NAD(P)-dependent dehydrogenase (short-subunit alcohol dehydrogenase family)